MTEEHPGPFAELNKLDRRRHETEILVHNLKAIYLVPAYLVSVAGQEIAAEARRRASEATSAYRTVDAFVRSIDPRRVAEAAMVATLAAAGPMGAAKAINYRVDSAYISDKVFPVAESPYNLNR